MRHLTSRIRSEKCIVRRFHRRANVIQCTYINLDSILREERKLRVFENMVLRRIFGPRRDKVMGEWRRLHNEELNDLYSSPNIVRVIKSRRMRWAGHVAHMGQEGGV